MTYARKAKALLMSAFEVHAAERRLEQAQVAYVFTGGMVVNLLLDFPEFAPVRPTIDIDIMPVSGSFLWLNT